MGDRRVVALERQARELGYTLAPWNPTPEQQKLVDVMTDPETAKAAVELIGLGHGFRDVAEDLVAAQHENAELNRKLERAHVAALMSSPARTDPSELPRPL